jgi:tetratricopeptide (TPR) repeat protein
MKRLKQLLPFSSSKFAALCFLAGSLASAPALRAQMTMPGQAMGSMGTEDEPPPGTLPVPRKMAGIGNVHLEITATPEAQMWFNQGLNLLHDFWDYESARAFEQSIRVDPKCAMCYWGLYKAEAFYHGTAQGYAGEALNQAVGLKDHVGKHDRLYIEASVAHENALAKSEANPDFSQEVRLWRKLAKKYPRDTQARIFLALSVEDGFDDQGEPRAGQKEALSVLQSVLKDEPDNSAANHYSIHALEPSAHPERALHSAEILANLAPASGHMVHMPGHIFFRVGDYARAEQAFAASMRVDESYMREQHVPPDDDWNYVHNLMYSIANLMEEGKLQEATALSAKLTGARGELEATLYIHSARDSISRLNPRLPVALRTADWAQVTELLRESSPPAALSNLNFLARQLSTFAAGMQSAEAGDLAKVEGLSSQFDAELWRISQKSKDSSDMQSMETNKRSAGPPKLERMPDAVLQPLLKTLSVMSLELRGTLLTARKKTAEARDLFAQAAKEEKALGYHEPPNYIRPVGETEAAALMAIGDWTDAKAAYAKALSERPRSGFPLYGIAVSSEQAGDYAAAAREYADFLAAWKNADRTLTQVEHAQSYLAAHPAVAESARATD